MTTKPRKKKRSTILVLVRGLDNNTCAAFGKKKKQHTPFSKVKSPESPKHGKEKVRGKGERGEECSKEGENEA